MINIYIFNIKKCNNISKFAYDFILNYFEKKYDCKCIIKKNKFGKPYIDNQIIKEKFNISHSEDHLVIAFANYEVGIDIEQINRVDELLINKYYLNQEKDIISNSNDKAKECVFFWTRKEAISKLLGIGIFKFLKNSCSIDANYYIKSFQYDKYIFSVCSYERINCISIYYTNLKIKEIN